MHLRISKFRNQAGRIHFYGPASMNTRQSGRLLVLPGQGDLLRWRQRGAGRRDCHGAGCARSPFSRPGKLLSLGRSVTPIAMSLLGTNGQVRIIDHFIHAAGCSFRLKGLIGGSVVAANSWFILRGGIDEVLLLIIVHLVVLNLICVTLFSGESVEVPGLGLGHFS
jgi:hypothetical protein